jgi:thiamine-phosphate pyrophosphorylase
MAIRSLDTSNGLRNWATKMARAGVDSVQIRDKRASDRSIFAACRSALAAFNEQAVAPETGMSAGRTSLLVNRRPDIATAVGAAGVHLPSRGLPIRLVREAFGSDLLIGRSTHSLQEVAAAQRAGADYVVFGPVYETPEKLRFGPPTGLDELARVCALGIPVLALGGLNLARLVEVAAAGAWGAAAIRLFEHPEQSKVAVETACRLFVRDVVAEGARTDD